MVKNLPVKIAQVYHIAIDEADRTDTGCSEIERRRRTKASRADQENLGLGDLLLPLATDLRQKNMPAVAGYLIFSKFHDGQFANPKGCSKWSANEAAGERKPEAYPLGYVEDFLEPRTKLGAIFSILRC
jgi:predicted metal-dependent phosphoesterase TrpH